MFVDLSQVSGSDTYHLMTQSLIPRPVAWVLSENESGSYNLAPFSFFTPVCSTPPLVMFSVGKKPTGEVKDTRRNIERTKAFVLHIASSDLAEPMTASAETLDYGVSEVDQAGLSVNHDWKMPLPRLDHCDLAFYCTLNHVHEVGENDQGLIFGEIKHAFIADHIVSSRPANSGRLQLNAKAINPIARLGASEYASLGDVFKIDRPK